MSVSQDSEVIPLNPPDATEDRPAKEATHFVQNPMRRLPVEVVSLAFQQYVLSGELPIVLGSVCRDWRYISWNNPFLWTHIRFGDSYGAWHATMKCREHLELTSQWLERSGSLPLHIELHWPINGVDSRNDEVATSLEKELPSLLKRFAGRWGILAFFLVPDHNLKTFFGENEYFAAPMLEKIRIELHHDDIHGDQSGDEFPYLYFSGCSPSFVDLGYIDLSLIVIDWKNLTRLTFLFGDNFGPDELIDILQSAPNLEMCKACGTYRQLRTRNDRTIRTLPFVHPKLKTLLLTMEEESLRQPFERFFFFVNLPSLHTLRVMCEDISDMVRLVSFFMFFLSKSATSLANLYIEGIPMPNPNYFGMVLRSMANLQTLAIAECSDLISDNFFESLEIARFLPSLSSFSYVGFRSFSWTSLEKLLQRMVAPPQDTVILCKCQFYLWGELDMDETLRQNLDTLTNAEVHAMDPDLSDYDEALGKVGFRPLVDEDEDEFWA